ncbi:MAG: hypothetical protein H6584_02840 [Flavobacteriales bacterium]|nr:hypothetical protein [Flavobacteriales bacterium]
MRCRLICLSFCLILFGCKEDDGVTTYTYTIENHSGAEVKIIGYSKTSTSVFPPLIIYLKDGEHMTKTHQDGLPPNPYDFSDFFERRDSIRVVFDNSKALVYLGECSENKRNPLNFCVYHSTVENFVITEEDYQNAEDCDGDCE